MIYLLSITEESMFYVVSVVLMNIKYHYMLTNILQKNVFD